MTEPTTTLTDYAIAVAALVFAISLLQIGWVKQQVSVRLWATAFFFVAVAAALGGTCHGFVTQLGSSLTRMLWVAMIYSLSLASFFMLTGTIFSSVGSKMQRWFLLGAITKSALTGAALIQTPRFEIAAFDYGSAMVIVLILQLSTLTQPTQAASWIISGILVSGLAIGVLISGVTWSNFLNHNDLYHLVQLVGLSLLYRGTKQLRDH